NRKHDLVDSAVLLVDDVEIGCAAVEKGIGVAVLPTFIADRKSKIRRISEELPELKTDLWVLSHEDQRNTTRISLLRSALSEYLKFDDEPRH
ncbi:MAG: LysR family transcriptional regulator, partial [Proteobacteria bacterium]|nr:LysR family transcriptional regulator [Pseudomonadota bacterium]